MRQVIRDIVAYVEGGGVGATLLPGQGFLDPKQLRFVCLSLCGWWGRGTLLRSRHPYLTFAPSMAAEFRRFFEAVPELNGLITCDNACIRFAEGVTRDEWQMINSFVREHHRPQLFSSGFGK